MPAHDADLALLIAAAQEAGKIANHHFGNGPETWEKPGDLGPVTEADLAVNAMLERDLQAARPGYGWLSEESEDADDRLSRERVFIIDPIDGTRAFIAGQRSWAHSLAIAENGEVVAAAVYLPQRDLLFAATAEGPATLNGVEIRAGRRRDLDSADILAAKPNMKPDFWQGPVPGFTRSFRPSLAYRLCLVAQGRFDAMLTLRDCWEWDIAAGDLICRRAGAQVTDRRSDALRFNAAHPQTRGCIAANPELHRLTLGKLRDDI